MTHASLAGAGSVAVRPSQSARRIAALAALCLLVLSVSGCAKLRARDLLNKGVQSFKNGQYDVAIEDFKQAKDLDPTLLNARLYLATAYATQYIPGAPSQENMQFGNQAIAEFKEVLQTDPNNLSAIDGIGSILFQMAGTPFDEAKFEESKTYHQKHIALQPNDPEPYYWIGVIDWTLAFRANGLLRVDYNKEHISKQIKDTDPLPRSRSCRLRSPKRVALIDEGIADLQEGHPAASRLRRRDGLPQPSLSPQSGHRGERRRTRRPDQASRRPNGPNQRNQAKARRPAATHRRLIESSKPWERQRFSIPRLRRDESPDWRFFFAPPLPPFRSSADRPRPLGFSAPLCELCVSALSLSSSSYPSTKPIPNARPLLLPANGSRNSLPSRDLPPFSKMPQKSLDNSIIIV